VNIDGASGKRVSDHRDVRRMNLPLGHRLVSTWRHSLIDKLFCRLCVLRQICKSHPAQDVRRLAELNVFISNDLNAISPRVEKVEKPSGQRLDACVG